MNMLIIVERSRSWCSLSTLAQIFTIFGVGFAVWIYWRWKRDYKSQKSREYALELFKKIKLLHDHIEQLRAPKFYHPNQIEEDLRKYYIPKINSRIIDEAVRIEADLFIADSILGENNGMLKSFNKLIKNPIINKIRAALFTFNLNLSRGKSYKETDLWSIVFPAESLEFDHTLIKESSLGTEREVINDEFNQTIESNFSEIYNFLKKEISMRKHDL